MRWPWSKKPVDPKTVGKVRSSEWARVRREFIKKHPECAACGSHLLPNLQVHHRKPFHLFPELELDESNLIVLCEDGPGNTNCHILVGHGGRWADYNPNVEADAAHQKQMIAGRIRG